MISESSRRFLALPVIVALLVSAAVSGCDSESLVTSDSGYLDTALSLLGPEGSAVGYADFEAIERHMDVWFESITGQAIERDRMTDEFESRTGVDVENDVDAIYASVEGGIGRDEGSIIIFGSFDTDEMIDRLDETAGISRIEHSGPDSFTAYGITGEHSGQYSGQPSGQSSGQSSGQPAEHESLYLAVSPDGYVLMTSSESRFESMMQRALSNDPTVAGGPFLDELSTYDAWMTVNDVRSVLPDVMPEGGQFGLIGPVFESVVRAGVGMDLSNESAEAVLLIQPREDVSTEDMANVVRGGIAAARFQITSNPDVPELFRDLLERIEVEARSNSVSVTMSISRSEVAELSESFRGDGF